MNAARSGEAVRATFPANPVNVNSQSQQPPTRPTQNRPGAIQAETPVVCSPDLEEIIRIAECNETCKNLQRGDSITVLEVHLSLRAYLDKIIPQNRLSNGHYTCDERLGRLTDSSTYDPADLRSKWRMLVRNFQLINNIRYRPRTHPREPIDDPSFNRTDSQSSGSSQGSLCSTEGSSTCLSTETLNSQEFRPTGVDYSNLQKREMFLRELLFAQAELFDKTLADVYTPTATLPQTVNNTTVNTYSQWKIIKMETSYKIGEGKNQDDKGQKRSLASEETSTAKKRKLSNNVGYEEDSDMCIICLDRKKTHAFLHQGLATSTASAHFLACRECAQSTTWADQGCPICRVPVINVIRIFEN